VSPDEVLAALGDRGALRRGHFLLSSGKHSDVYVEKARAFEDPELVLDLAREMASWFEGVEAVVSPAVGAIPLGFAVALSLPARFLYAERVEGRLALRRGFRLRSGERTLVVEDVVTTGGSAGEVLELIGAADAEPVGVAAVVDRTQDPPGFSLRTLARLEANLFDPGECPLCAAGEELEAPGSRFV
jgi:orotate phosphoribosyltransferase